MMLKKYYIADSTFYITHACNLTCHNCETYNNRKFKGHYTWAKYEKDYEAWSHLVDLGIVNIHGGEPFTNPDLYNWAIGLKRLWPNSKDYTISTNGSILNKKSDLVKDLVLAGWRLDISVHDPVTFEYIKNNFIKILEDINISVKLDQGKEDGEIVVFDESNSKCLATILPQYYFLKNSTKYIKQGKIYMHRSDVEKAHHLCQHYDNMPPCRWFVAGHLFKCHLTAISNDLINQFTIEEDAVELLKKYKPASAYESSEYLEKFFQDLDKPLAQCTLCPEKSTLFPIYPLSSKKK